jgi:Tat protein translocase TatB subunit
MMKHMNLGFGEMLFLGMLALLIFGPKKLPEIGRQVGRALAEFKRASDEFKSQIQSEINKIDLEERAKNVLPPAELAPSAPIGSVVAGSLPAETSTTELSSQAHDA